MHMLTSLLPAVLCCCCSSCCIQVPVKDRPGNLVITYHMDVRTEPVETLMGDSLAKQKGQAGVYSPMGQWNVNDSQRDVLERQMANGRVHANAW